MSRTRYLQRFVRDSNRRISDSFYILTQPLCCVNISFLVNPVATSRRLLYVNTLFVVCQYLLAFPLLIPRNNKDCFFHLSISSPGLSIIIHAISKRQNTETGYVTYLRTLSRFALITILKRKHGSRQAFGGPNCYAIHGAIGTSAIQARRGGSRCCPYPAFKKVILSVGK